MQTNKAVWGLLHILAIISVGLSLVTGLRIAILNYDYLLQFSHLLPQGEMHGLHILSACLFTLTVLSYVLFRAKGQMPSIAKLDVRNGSIRFHIFLTRTLYVISLLSMVTGWILFTENFQLDKSTILLLHYVSALLFLSYFLLHGGAWIIEFGSVTFIRMFRPLFQTSRYVISACVIAVLMLTSWIAIQSWSHHILKVGLIGINEHMQIDGKMDEPPWQGAKPLTVYTHGGANFVNGATPITLRALQNGADLFMHLEWEDDTESLTHLPLIKTESGWRIQQNGFHEFNEKTFYEDKLAIIVANNCDFAAGGTAHLGPQPLKDKPKHWAGQGYHYTDGGIVDLWHWKAVRTNHMRLMDDGHIGEPDSIRVGSRRYSAGYKTDARESGAYKMNWKWYSPNTAIPKRIPVQDGFLKPYQAPADDKQAETPWLISWFDGMTYSSEKDTYTIGTVMPSILYTSNQFEGDRAHVRAFAQWNEGKWSLELFRRLETGSENDIAISDGICLWVAAFDHAQIAHTRHTRPIKMTFIRDREN